jgi:hypothetical protein
MKNRGVFYLCALLLFFMTLKDLQASEGPDLFIASSQKSGMDLRGAISSVGAVPYTAAVTLKHEYGIYAILFPHQVSALRALDVDLAFVTAEDKLTAFNVFTMPGNPVASYHSILASTGFAAIFAGFSLQREAMFFLAGERVSSAAVYLDGPEALAYLQKRAGPNISASFLVSLVEPMSSVAFMNQLTGVITPPGGGGQWERKSHIVEVPLTLSQVAAALELRNVISVFLVGPDLSLTNLNLKVAAINLQLRTQAGLASNENYQKNVPQVSLAYEGRNQATVEALRGLGVNLMLYEPWIGYQTSSCQQIHNDVAMRGNTMRISYLSYPWVNGKACVSNPSASTCNSACLTSAFRVHGHQVASVMSSSGLLEPGTMKGQGVQDLANIRFSSSYQPNVNYFATMLTQAVSSQGQAAVVAKASGQPAAVHFAGKTGYTPVAAMIDEQLMRVYPGTQNRDVAVFQAIGNNGVGLNGAPAPGVTLLDAQAKNVINVGGVWHQGSLVTDDDVFRSIGVCQIGDCPPWFQPTTPSFGSFLDGRVGVDLAGYVSGYRAVATRTGSYGNFMHTSSATAAVTSHAGMIQAAWRNNLFKAYNLNTASFVETNHSGSVFSSRLPWTALKALMSSMAAPYAADRSDRPTRAQMGLGYLEIGRFLESNSLRPQALVMHQYDLLQTGQERTVSVSVPPLQSELRVSLAWADAPALIPGGAAYASVPTLRNDFDLELISPNGQTVYVGNAGLLNSIYSEPMTRDEASAAADRVESLEHIRVRYPEGGVWQVRIIATAIRADIDPSNTPLNSPYGAAIAIVP